MTITHGTTTAGDRDNVPGFATPEGLRALLTRLRDTGPGAWQQDPDASALVQFTIQKYRRLARKWGRDPADIGYEAFIAMQSDKILDADDPWGFVTRAVQRSVISETIGDRLLVSPARARKGASHLPDAPARAGDRDWLYDFQPVPAPSDEHADEHPTPELDRLSDAVTNIHELLVGLGWPEHVTADAVEYVLSRAGDAGSLMAARELLRKETDMPRRFGLPDACWPGLLRVLLGGKNRPGRPTHCGVLVRLMHYDTIDTLLGDDDLIVEIALAAPQQGHTDG